MQRIAALWNKGLLGKAIIGTVPDAADGSELPAVSIFVLRSDFARWDGIAENLGEWRISLRYK